MFGNIGTPEIILILMLIFIVYVIIKIIPYRKIYERTGQSGAMALLQLIPIVNYIMLFILAFGEWPIEKKIKEQ